MAFMASLLACAGGSVPEPTSGDGALPAAAASAAFLDEPTMQTAAPPADSATPAYSDSQDEPASTAAASPAAMPRRPLPDGYLSFEDACRAADIVTISAIGDLLIHHELQRQAYAAPDRFINLWSGVVDLFAKADISYANLEGPTAFGIDRKGKRVKDPGLAFDNSVYTGYPRFNYHPSLAEDLVRSGLDVVSTANNHALDRGMLGVDRTLDALDKAGLLYTGTRRQGADDAWHAITRARGMTIAWLACTSHTIIGKDEPNQVLDCYKDPERVEDLVRALAEDEAIDAVIVTPHWGKEYVHEPTDKQRKYARAWAEAGATAIIGSHPHVLQPWERLVTADGRETFVMYSLGNFASHQQELPRRSSMVLYLGLGRRADGVVVPVGARYVPLNVRMVGDAEAYYVEAIDRVRGPNDARDLVVSIFGAHNLLAPDRALDVRPHCDPAWP